jgi:hypothetical protein
MFFCFVTLSEAKNLAAAICAAVMIIFLVNATDHAAKECRARSFYI